MAHYRVLPKSFPCLPATTTSDEMAKKKNKQVQQKLHFTRTLIKFAFRSSARGAGTVRGSSKMRKVLSPPDVRRMQPSLKWIFSPDATPES
jgi:hypothetical protein